MWVKFGLQWTFIRLFMNDFETMNEIMKKPIRWHYFWSWGTIHTIQYLTYVYLRRFHSNEGHQSFPDFRSIWKLWVSFRTCVTVIVTAKRRRSREGFFNNNGYSSRGILRRTVHTAGWWRTIPWWHYSRWPGRFTRKKAASLLPTAPGRWRLFRR